MPLVDSEGRSAPPRRRRIALLISKEWPALYLTLSMRRAGLDICLAITEREPADDAFLNPRRISAVSRTNGRRNAIERFFGFPFGVSYSLRRLVSPALHPLPQDLRSCGIPLLEVDSFLDPECEQRLRQAAADVVVICGTPILPERLLTAASEVTLNTHTSVLPHYRGGGSIFWGLFFRDPDKIGYTIHRAVAKVDAGDILCQERVAVAPGDTPETLLQKCFLASVPKLISLLRDSPLDAGAFQRPASGPIPFSFRAPDPVVRAFAAGPSPVKSARRLVKQAIYVAGRRKRAARPGVSVFYYHRALPDSTPPGDWRRVLGHPTRSELRERLEYLKGRMRLIRLDEFIALLDRGAPATEPLGVVTVDDGYRDFLSDVLPVHEAAGVPVTLFACSGAVAGGTVWYQRLYDLIDGIRGERLHVPWMGTSIYFGDIPHRVITVEKVLIAHLKRLSRTRRRERLEQLLAATPAVPLDTRDAFCSPEEIRTLAAHPLVEVHLHSHEHDPYETLNDDELRRDVLASREYFSSVLGLESAILAYPNGSFKPGQEGVLAASGVRFAMTVQPRPVPARNLNPHSIPRFGMSGCSLSDLHWNTRNL